MKRQYRGFLMATASLLLFAFCLPPSDGTSQKPLITLVVTTVIYPDRSGIFQFGLVFSKEAVNQLESSPQPSGDSFCGEVKTDLAVNLDLIVEEKNGEITCSTLEGSADLAGMEFLTKKYFPGVHFQRLEMTKDRLYYDLVWNAGVPAEGNEGDLFAYQAYWIVRTPGDVVKSNSTKSDGRTLTWDLLTVDRSSHIQVESKISPTGRDTVFAVTTIGALLLLSCCCIVALLAGGLAIVLTRRKKSAPGNPTRIAETGNPNL